MAITLRRSSAGEVQKPGKLGGLLEQLRGGWNRVRPWAGDLALGFFGMLTGPMGR